MSGRDIFFIMILLVVFGTGLFAAHFISTTIYNKMQTTPAINTTAGFSKIMESSKSTSNKLDYVYLGFFIGLLIFTIVSAWIVSGHPVFMVFYTIMGLIAVIISPLLSNLWETFSTTAAITGSLTYFPITNHLLTNLPSYLLIFFILGLIILYGKPYIGNTQNEQI